MESELAIAISEQSTASSHVINLISIMSASLNTFSLARARSVLLPLSLALSLVMPSEYRLFIRNYVLFYCTLVKLEFKSHGENLNYKVNTPSVAFTTAICSPSMIIALYYKITAKSWNLTAIRALFSFW